MWENKQTNKQTYKQTYFNLFDLITSPSTGSLRHT